MAIRELSGWRFRPTDQQLISYYLEPKERGLWNACDYIVEKELYGADATPWKVFGKEDERYWVDIPNSKNKTMIFAFCKPKKVGNSTKKMCRVAGCGTWDENRASKVVRNSAGEIMWKKKTFTFMPKEGFESEMEGKGKWIMNELSVEGYNYVVCRITRDLSKDVMQNRKRKSAAANQGEDEDIHPRKKLCNQDNNNDNHKDDFGDPGFVSILKELEERLFSDDHGLEGDQTLHTANTTADSTPNPRRACIEFERAFG